MIFAIKKLKHIHFYYRKGVICQFLILLFSSFLFDVITADECHLTPVFHVLKYPGCIPKPIPSFACTGKCTSYVQVRFKVLKVLKLSNYKTFVLKVFVHSCHKRNEYVKNSVKEGIKHQFMNHGELNIYF